MARRKENKLNDYPLLDNQQLLSLIRANQLMLTDLEEKYYNLKNELTRLKNEQRRNKSVH